MEVTIAHIIRKVLGAILQALFKGLKDFEARAKIEIIYMAALPKKKEGAKLLRRFAAT